MTLYPSTRILWQEKIPAFNVKRLVKNDSIYTTGIGFVGKIDLHSGNYIWKQISLYDKYNCNNFKKLQINGDNLECYYESGSYQHQDNMVLIFAKQNGQLLKAGKVNPKMKIVRSLSR